MNELLLLAAAQVSNPDDAASHLRRHVHLELLGPKTHDPQAVLLQVVNDLRHVCGSLWTSKRASGNGRSRDKQSCRRP